MAAVQRAMMETGAAAPGRDQPTKASAMDGARRPAGTLTRADLAEALHGELGLSRAESAALVEQVLGAIGDALLAGENVKLSSFGSFMLRRKGERVGRNPKTGVEVPIEPRTVLTFRPSQLMRQHINS